MLETTATDLPGLVIVEPRVFRDARGAFLETWNRSRYAEAGLDAVFVQDNVSVSTRGVLRGLHFQNPHAQGKLVYALAGSVYDVAVDIRVGSPAFGRWLGVELSADNARQLFVPPGFAHGFCVLSERAVFAYKCTDFYVPRSELCVRWDDPEIGIEWPLAEPVLSEKDAGAPALREIAPNRLPSFQRRDRT